MRYIAWLGVKCKVFNLASVRREMTGEMRGKLDGHLGAGSNDPRAAVLRAEVQEEAERQIEAFFEGGGQVAIYDASNSNSKSREEIRQRFMLLQVQIMFIECMCDDQAMVNRNIRFIYQFSPDYAGWVWEDVQRNFEARILQNELCYEPIENATFPHIQLLNFGERIVVNNNAGYLQNRLVFFLMNVHNRERKIYFARAGEALIEHSYKADAELSSLGLDYANALATFVSNLHEHTLDMTEEKAHISQRHTVSWLHGVKKQSLEHEEKEEKRGLEVWCSTRKRSVLTAEPFRKLGYKVLEHTRLAEMNPGVVDGLSQAEILHRFPGSVEQREKDPYSFRFPRAESYHDLAIRLEPIIFELERTRDDMLIIGQSSVLRCLIAYLQGNKPSQIPFIQVREGDLVEIQPQPFGVSSRVFSFWDPKKKRVERDIEFATRTAFAMAREESSGKDVDIDQVLKDVKEFALRSGPAA
ncbi:hypothetical protein MVES1_002054 [Malassezia vespertilionis]|nr:uncharacterized protein MVES1_002054 [Malassezia vespertilionis]WFD06700.1 hypothetical protein MVES1_002054 [Malassezia vespertilionis]